MEVLNKEKVLENAKRLIDEGKVDKAIIEYRRLLDIDPKDMRIKLRIAELLARQKKVSDAVRVYKEVADSYSIDGFYLKAVTVYKNVLRLNPSLMEINYKLAELYEKMGLNRDAIHQYQILANMLEQKGDQQGLINVRKRIVALDSHNVSNRIRLAETYQYQGMEEASLNEYEGLVGEIKDVGKVDQMVELYEKILSYRPDNLDMVKALTQIYYRRGEWKKVITHLKDAEEIIAKETDLILMQADVYARLNQVETSKGKYKDVAEIFIENGDIDKALDAYKEILVVSPEDEGEIKGLVDEIDPDFFEKVKREAEEKRKRLEEMAEQMEADVVAAEGDAEPAKPGEKREKIQTLTPEKIKIKLHEADAAFELGKAYRQMGLSDEASLEIEKSLDIYRDLESGGYLEEPVPSRIAELAGWVTGEKEAPSKTPAGIRPGKKVEEEETAELPEIGARAKAFKQKPAEKAEAAKQESKKKEVKKKKKDKRVGFV